MNLNLKSLKIMQFGLMLLILGATMVVDPSTNMLGLEYYLMFGGLIIGFIGLIRQD